MSSVYQLGRGHELVFKNGVAYDSKLDLYHVKSISQKNFTHFVTKKGKKLECDCLGFMYNDKKCSHLTAVRIYQRSLKK